MSEQKTSFLPKIELLILGVFMICFILYATSKCSATKAQYAAEDAEVLAEQDSTTEKAVTPVAKPDSTPVVKPTTGTQERYTPLYATVAGANVRAEPKLNGRVVDQLALYEEVTFLNETTKFKQEISLGKITRNEPWVKIRTNRGRTGWVFGANVHYYKLKLEGVE